MNTHSASTTSATPATVARRPGRPAARRARPSAAVAPRRRILMQTSLGLIEAIHGPDLVWPDGETTVEFICAAVCKAG